MCCSSKKTSGLKCADANPLFCLPTHSRFALDHLYVCNYYASAWTQYAHNHICVFMNVWVQYILSICLCLYEHNTHIFIYICLLVNVCVSMSVCVSMCWCVCVLILLCYHSHHIHPILFALARFCVLCLLMRPILQQHKCQTHVQEITDFVMAFWHKIDIGLAWNLLRIDTKRLFKGRIV